MQEQNIQEGSPELNDTVKLDLPEQKSEPKVCYNLQMAELLLFSVLEL